MPKSKKTVTNWDDVPLYIDLPLLATLWGFSVDCLKKKHSRAFAGGKDVR